MLVNPYGKAVEKIILNGIRDISNVKYCGNFSFWIQREFQKLSQI